MKIYMFLILALAITTECFSQTGPGGVGGNLIFWVKADVGVEKAASTAAANGDAVSTWLDQSGSGNNATSPSTGAIFTTGIFNSLPVLRFDESDAERLTASFSIGADENLFLVASNRGSANHTFVDDGATTNKRRIFTDLDGFKNPSCIITYPDFQSNPSTSIADDLAFLTSFEINSAGDEKHWVNGNIILSKAVTPGTCESIIIGNDQSLYSKLDGDISEIVIYNTTLNSTQRIIINNYLAAKYGVTLSANALYAQASGANGDYDFEVAGIGRIDASNLHNDAQGSGIVRILNPSNLGDNEFLIWGHDDGIQQASETTDVPAPVVARFERVWRVSEVNTSSTAVNVGNIDIRFDLTGLGSVTASDLRLLIDTDNDGVFSDETPISGATSIGSNVYQFAAVSAIANNLRFTIGTINKTQTPLPIELIYFNAKIINKEFVRIFWQTASETNNDYFTIERSENNLDWNAIKTIDGAGNSSKILNYDANDYKPYSGLSYYRLKQTDFDGEFSYSSTISVNNQGLTKRQVKIYPNPTNNKITLIANSDELETISVYNIHGENVTNQILLIEDNKDKLIIDLSKLSVGIYYIKTKTTANKVYKQ